ncbi:unnamed protein product, partial [Ectocarpus sp. 8 AP-2014]
RVETGRSQLRRGCHVQPRENEHGGGRDGNFDGGGERDGRPAQRRRSRGAPLRPAKAPAGSPVSHGEAVVPSVAGHGRVAVGHDGHRLLDSGKGTH